jgi:hypothetical protein
MYDSEEEIERLVRDFESCAIQAADFHHREHLVVAVWYLRTLSRAQAVNRMRAGLLRFLEYHGVDARKYSEEVTVFWVDAVATQLEGMGSEALLVEQVNQIVLSFSSTARTPGARVGGEE